MSSLTKDTPLKYAEDVVYGKIAASKAIEGVSKRYLEWRIDGKYRYDKEAVDKVIRFCSTVICLQGEHSGKPFIPLPWQQFVFSNIYGFLNEDGNRVIQKGWLESAKGSGKLMISVSIGLYSLVVEAKTTDQQIFVFARDYKQVRPIMDATCNAIRSSDRLQQKLHIYGGTKSDSIFTSDLRSKLELFSADSHKGKSGYLPSKILADEAMEWDSGDAFELLEKNYKSRGSPLSFITSNSGTSLDSYAGKQHQHAIRVASGEVEDDSFLPLVYSVDTLEDIGDEDMWIKSNPSLPVIPGFPYIRKAIKDAEHFPASKSEMERLQFGIWGTSKSYWIDPDVWKSEVEVEELDFPEDGQEVVLSVDIGKTRDLTGLTTLWGSDVWNAIVETWIPIANLKDRERRDNVDYSVWIEDGDMFESPGKVMNLDVLAEDIYQKCTDMYVSTLVYDPWLWSDLEAALQDVGIEVTSDYSRAMRNRYVVWGLSHKQTFKAYDAVNADKKPRTLAQKRRREEKRDKPSLSMGRSIAEAEMRIIRGKLRVQRSAPLWLALQTSVVDINDDGLKKFNKGKSTQKIDPLISLVMAIGGRQALELRKKVKTEADPFPNFSPKEALAGII